MPKWYIAKGPDPDVVLTSRVRIARNIRDIPFPVKMSEDQAQSAISKVHDAIEKNEKLKKKNFRHFNMSKLKNLDKMVLIEKHLISPDIARCPSGCGAFISRDERISLMINEEDHVRIQCMLAGNDTDSALDLCLETEEKLAESIEFAYNATFGYLTSCPTNVGTGIRVSAMLHLPALTITGHMKSVLEACSKLRIAVRGIYGENSESLGRIYQVSNQVTLGQNEKEIVAVVKNVINQIIEQERLIRNEMFKINRTKLSDKIKRSYGIFTNAEIMTSSECLNLISDVRLGIDLGIISNISIEKLNEIMLLVQPGNLQKHMGKLLSEDERDFYRAKLIDEILKPDRSDKNV